MNNLLVNVYYREVDTLKEGKGFQMFGNCLQNCCVRYFLSDTEMDALNNNHMVMHDDMIIVPIGC